MSRRVLLLPGFACTADIWRPVLDDLLSRGEVTAADWPGHGLETMHRVEDLAEWVRTTLHPERFDAVVGHSLGGLVALAALADTPSPAPRVVLVETFLTPPAPFFHGITRRAPADDPAAARVHTMLERERPRWSPMLALTLRGRAHLDLLARAPAVTAAIYGGRDATTAAAVSAALGWPAGLGDRIPVAVIPDAAHFPMLERPRETSRVLRVSLG